MHQDRWKNRRLMAWISLIAGLAFPLLLLYTESDQLGAVAGPFYIFVMGVVGAYIGFATFDDKWQQVQSFDRDNRVSNRNNKSKNNNIDETLEQEGFPPEPK